MEEYVILVDNNDNKIGLEEKVKCHLPNGKLHRAFTVLIFDKQGKLVLTRRSKNKMLWPGDWDGTFASHPREGETYISSGERRMPEEVGLQTSLEYLFKFEYHVQYKDVGSENEICGTLIGIVEPDVKYELVEDEISELKAISPDELLLELTNQPRIYCPWMLIALFLLDSTNSKINKEYYEILKLWIKPEIKTSLGKAIDTHLEKSQWRLIQE